MLLLSRSQADNVIAKMIGRQWQGESEEVREAYRTKAAGVKAAFMAEHPNYKCAYFRIPRLMLEDS